MSSGNTLKTCVVAEWHYAVVLHLYAATIEQQTDATHRCDAIQQADVSEHLWAAVCTTALHLDLF